MQQPTLFSKMNFILLGLFLIFIFELKSFRTASECGQSFLSPLSSSILKSASKTAVVGGDRVDEGLRKAYWPWMVAVFRKNGNTTEPICGGALVSDRYVVSAAHCFPPSRRDNIEYEVRLGILKINEISEGSQIIPIKTITKYPEYKEPVIYGDIAVVELSQSATIGQSVRALCLPVDDPNISPTQFYLAGWGSTDYGHPTSVHLMEVTVALVSQEDCQKVYSLNEYLPKGITDQLICAGNTIQSKDACQGDSGGPLTSFIQGRWTLEGIVSAGQGCGNVGVPGLYTRLRSFLPWIKQQIQT